MQKLSCSYFLLERPSGELIGVYLLVAVVVVVFFSRMFSSCFDYCCCSCFHRQPLGKVGSAKWTLISEISSTESQFIMYMCVVCHNSTVPLAFSCTIQNTSHNILNELNTLHMHIQNNIYKISKIMLNFYVPMVDDASASKCHIHGTNLVIHSAKGVSEVAMGSNCVLCVIAMLKP